MKLLSTRRYVTPRLNSEISGQPYMRSAALRLDGLDQLRDLFSLLCREKAESGQTSKGAAGNFWLRKQAGNTYPRLPMSIPRSSFRPHKTFRKRVFRVLFLIGDFLECDFGELNANVQMGD